MPRVDRARQIIAEHYDRNDPIGWFEALYSEAASAGGAVGMIPWADQKPNPHLSAWLHRNKIGGAGRTAIVVGCGLGDDAEALAELRFDVTAFDLSRNAITWARQRFAGSNVRYTQADLFDLPPGWKQAFDFVFEAYTIQALPRSLRKPAIESVASLVAPGGDLLVVCRGREDDEPEGELPWPLSHGEVGRFEKLGLERSSFENFMDETRDPPVRRFRALFTRSGK